jgi:hypothetical protein
MVFSDDLENSHLTRPRKDEIWTGKSEEKEQAENRYIGKKIKKNITNTIQHKYSIRQKRIETKKSKKVEARYKTNARNRHG